MKIGILTYHRSHNYGALLQGVAFRRFLESRGHDVSFIDYWPEYHQRLYRVWNSRGFKQAGIAGKLRHILSYLLLRAKKKERIRVFERFIAEYVTPYAVPYGSDEHFDAVVYGSDQIWRKQELHDGCFNPVYFACGEVCTDKHIAYSASMGKIDIDLEDAAFLKEKLGGFDHIAVREADLQTMLGKLGIDARLTLDPTLLLSAEEWEHTVKIPEKRGEPYVLYYELLGDSISDEAVMRFARAKGLRVVKLMSRVLRKPGGGEGIEIVWKAGPAEFLGLVRGAEYVVTSSYHGLVFSLLMRREVYASFAHNSGRAATILQALGLSERLLLPKSEIPTDGARIDYAEVQQRLQKLRQDSLLYLASAGL